MKKHIVFIGDDKDELRLFISAFNQLNIPYKCTWATSGEQALKQLDYLTPDLIIFDVFLPYMDGFECLGAIKHRPHLKACPVILYSTNMSIEWRDKSMQLGAAACLVKSDASPDLAAIAAALLSMDMESDWDRQNLMPA